MTNISQLDLLRKFNEKEANYNSEMTKIYGHRYTEYKEKYNDQDQVPRPKHWSGWNLNPIEIEFWLDGKDRIHERLCYIKKNNNKWEKNLLSP